MFFLSAPLEDRSVGIMDRSRETSEEAIGIAWMTDARDLNFDHVVGMEGEGSGRWPPGLNPAPKLERAVKGVCPQGLWIELVGQASGTLTLSCMCSDRLVIAKENGTVRIYCAAWSNLGIFGIVNIQRRRAVVPKARGSGVRTPNLSSRSSPFSQF